MICSKDGGKGASKQKKGTKEGSLGWSILGRLDGRDKGRRK